MDALDAAFPALGEAGPSNGSRYRAAAGEGDPAGRPPAAGAPTGRLLFGEDFDRPAARNPAPEPEIIAPSFSAAELEAARADAWRAGSEAAAAEAAAADHAALRQAVAAIAERLEAARDELIDLAEQTAASIAQLLLGSLGAVLPELAVRYGEAELQAIVRAIVPGLFKEPAVTLRLNPRHCVVLTQEIARVDPDLAARMQVVPTDSLPLGDLRIAWRNGGATRDAAALWAQVAATLGIAGFAPQHVEAREIEHAG